MWAVSSDARLQVLLQCLLTSGMMGFLGMGNNPMMVGATVAIAVSPSDLAL